MLHISSRLDKLITAALLLFAFFFCYAAGIRGIYALDQSIVFDGAYRIVQGQAPWKDFIVPFGPISLWYQAIFFQLLGVSYPTYVIGAAVSNVIGTLAAIQIVKLLLPKQPFFAYTAGFLTAIWFYSPSGTTYIEQTGLVFGILLVWLAVSLITRSPDDRRAHWWKAVLAGSFACFAGFSKQNMGLLVLPLFPIIMMMTIDTHGWRRYFGYLVAFGVGAALALAGLMLVLVLTSDINTFIKYFLEMPSRIGSARFSNWRYFVEVTLQTPAVVLAVTLCGVVGLASLLRSVAAFLRADWRDPRDLTLDAAVVCGTLVVFTIWFMKLANKTHPNSLSMAGLAVALGLGMVAQWAPSLPPVRRLRTGQNWLAGERLASLLAILMIVALAADGMYVALGRQAHEGTRFASTFVPLEHPNYRGTQWGNPTRVDNAWEGRPLERGTFVSNTEIDELTEYLAADGENFFIFPDHTFLYGTLGVPSPQPLVWFLEGQTYPFEDQYDPALDQWVVDDLVRYNVQTIVVEEVSFFDTAKTLRRFPKLQHYIENSFTPVEQIGIFTIHKKNPSS
jgi:hypothetical protein